jgi:hypothetical protein
MVKNLLLLNITPHNQFSRVSGQSVFSVDMQMPYDLTGTDLDKAQQHVIFQQAEWRNSNFMGYAQNICEVETTITGTIIQH